MSTPRLPELRPSLPLWSVALAILLAPPAAAQQPAAAPPTLHTRAIAAGYKAAMLCSGLFNARNAGASRDVASIEAHELRGIYPEYDALIAAMPAQIDRKRLRVSVRYDVAMPPRLAVNRGDVGCELRPIGTPETYAPASWILRQRSVGRPAKWPVADPDSLFATQPRLAPLLERAFAGGYGERTDTTGVLILAGDRVLAERYAPGFGPHVPQRTWSVAKSIAGTIIGAAVKQGLIALDLPAPIPEWQDFGDPRQAITLDHLLRMASGLHSDTAGNRTDMIYFGGGSVTQETVAWPIEVPPGTRFRYANNDILLAMRGLRARMGDRAESYPFDLLLGRVAMTRTFPERDWQGNYILSSQVWATARDLARLGILWLHDGVWQGERLLPEGWMRTMTSPSGPQPETGAGYGATLWLFGPDQGLPAGSYAAQGNRGQFVMVVPARNLIVVRRGEDPSGAGFDIAKFTADVAAAIE